MADPAEVELNYLRRKGVSPNEHNIYTGVPTDDRDGRGEKPWQRVYTELTKKGTHLDEPVKSVPCAGLILLLGVYLLLAYFTQLVEDGMPKVVSEINVARDDSTTFSEEPAWRYLNIILGDAPRVSGTRRHLEQTKALQDLLNSIAAQSNTPVTVQYQLANDDYLLKFGTPSVNAYQNVSNLIALLEGEAGFHSNGTLGTSLLVNCHYDSVPYAQGASDDGVFCAVMVEVLAKLARRSQRLKHNVIFLFNGAEENLLQGSHAFIRHPWSRGITNVINLDAAGMNGKPAVFQANDPRLMRIYSRVTKRPSAQSVGEFLFKTGVIPSDTDFRIWRDYGPYYGIDIAFTKSAHVYHTRYDHPDLIKPGVIQNAGDTLLALITAAADTEELKDPVEPSSLVYFDFLYWWMVAYTPGVALVFDLFAVAAVGLSVAYYVWLVGLRKSTLEELGVCMAGRLAAMGCGFLVCLVVIPIMVAIMGQMRYMTQPWTVVPHFWMPYLITAVSVSHLYDAWRTSKIGLSRSIRSLQAMTATRLLLAILLLILLCTPGTYSVRYMLSLPLYIMSATSILMITIVRYVKIQAWQQLLLEVVFSLPTTMFLYSLVLKLDAILLPTMGRSPIDKPDYVVALMNVVLAAIVASTVSGIELLFSRKSLWVVLTPLVVVCVILMFIPFSPYQDDGPSTQRHYWFHTEVVSYDQSGAVTARRTGVLVTKFDKYSLDYVLPALRDHGINVDSRREWSDACARAVHCDLPLYRTRFGDMLKDSLLLSTGGPKPFDPPSEISVVNRTCDLDQCTVAFRMVGTAHNFLTLWPRSGVNMTSWSFASPLDPTFSQLDRPVYVIVHSVATYSERFEPFDFVVTFNVPQGLQSQPIVDLSHHAHKIHHPEDYTDEYRTILNAMPKYFNIASHLSFRRNYMF